MKRSLLLVPVVLVLAATGFAIRADASSSALSLNAGDSVQVHCNGSRLTVSGTGTSRSLDCHGTVTPSPSPSSTTPTPTPTASSTFPTPTPTPSDTATGSPTGSPSPTPTPTVTTTPGGFPNASNTGYRLAKCPNGLTRFSGTINSNTTYSCMDFPGGVDVGSKTSSVSNVIFTDDWFHGAAPEQKLVGLFGSNITFSWSTWSGGSNSSCSQSYQYGIVGGGTYYTHVAGLEVDHSDFSDWGNAIDVTGSTQAAPDVYVANYIHGTQTGCDYHNDGIGALDTGDHDSYFVIDGNTIDDTGGNTNAIAYQYNADHGTVNGNALSGGNDTLNLGGKAMATNTAVTNNVYEGGAQFAAVYSWTNGNGNTWSGNTLANGSVWNP